MRNQFTKCTLFIVFLFCIQAIQAQVSGNVFRDFNANGIKTTAAPDPIEIGLAGVTVNAYDVNGTLITATTIANGNYTITGGVGPYRIEFILPPFYYASNGTLSSSTVQFVAAGGTANLGVNSPGDYCQDNPYLSTTIFYNGDPLGSGTTANSDAIVAFKYNDVTSSANPVPMSLSKDAKSVVTGAVYGLAYNKTTKKLFSSAFFKRHVGWGEKGIGGIYVTDYTTLPGITTSLIDLSTLGISLLPAGAPSTLLTNGGRALTPNLSDPTNDSDAFDYVAKAGLGDMDISSDGKKLYVVNLAEKNIIVIDIAAYLSTGTAITMANISTINPVLPVCGNGVARPFALKIVENKLLLGVTCTGENAGATINDVNISVQSLDLSTNTWTTVLNPVPMDYTKGPATDGLCNTWNSWTDDASNYTFGGVYTSGIGFNLTIGCRPSPLLSDIEIDESGNMVLSIMDRSGHQWGFANYDKTGTTLRMDWRSGGDILKAGKCTASATTWTLENNGGICGAVGSTAQQNLQGPGGGEFFYQEFGYISGANPYAHQETSFGSLAILLGQNQVLQTAMDPIQEFSGGVLFLDNTNGSTTKRAELYYDPYAGTVLGTSGKANGLGDIELLCNAAPIEIGNRVFMDTDEDGIQDADEMGIDGVLVKLYKAGIAVDSIPTANGGQWYFTNLDATTPYEVKILGVNIPSGKQLTTTNAVSNTKDLIDNDAVLIGTNAVIAYTTGNAGENNHTLDFGFKVACLLTASATGTNVKCNLGTDGTATAVAAGNLGAVTYKWSDAAGSTTAAITGLSAGTYTVTITETASCTATASYTVTEPTALVLTCAKTDVTTVGGSDGTASVTASGGTTTYTYLWSNAATTASITGLTSGTYIVTVTDANGCMKVCSSVVTQPSASTCNLLDGGVTVVIDEKGTSSTADDEYVIYANPTGTGLATTYNVSGDITKAGVAYGAKTEIGRVSTANSTMSYMIEDSADAGCNLIDAAFDFNNNACILKANPTVVCNNNGTPNNPSDDTFSVSLNPTRNGISATYNVTGGITASNVAYGSAQQIATGLLISAGAVTITLKDATTANCELLNIRIDPPAACSSNGIAKLDLVKTVDLAEAKVGDNVTYTIVVRNTGTAPSNAIEVTDTLNSNLQFILATPAAAYNSTTGVWTVGVLPVGDSATLTIVAKLLAIGVTQNHADITLGGNNDSDGPLNNHDVLCTTVPIELCAGTSFTLTIPSNFTEIQWFKNGVAIAGATSINLLVSTIGDYTFTAKETNCPVDGCCPIRVVAGTNCCPAKICLPVKLKRN